MGLLYVENPEIHADAVAELRVKVGWDARKEQLEKILGSTYLTVACFDDKDLVGIIDVISDGIDDALIRNLIVHPEYQGKGIGNKLLIKVLDRLKRNRIKTINVLFEDELSEFYREAGFRIVSGGIIDNEEGF